MSTPLLVYATELKGQSGRIGEFQPIPSLTLPDVGYWPTGKKMALNFSVMWYFVVLGIARTSEEESEEDMGSSLRALITFTTYLLSGFSFLLS